jgi:hypothetical protein
LRNWINNALQALGAAVLTLALLEIAVRAYAAFLVRA